MVINPPSHPEIVRTDIMLENISKNDIEKAKSLFLKFSDQGLVESSEYGDVYKKNGVSNIYINGEKVAEENNF